MDVALWKKPSAVLAMSVPAAALSTVLGHVALYGAVHEADEGTAAHIWQLLMAAEVPLVTYFAWKWLPRAKREAVRVLVLLGGVVLANLAAVYYLT